MKTQISRNSFRPAKRYAGVYQQQGRMLTDADWNELVDLLKGHLAEALKDVVGTGSPRTGKVTITGERQIQPGDLYVDGFRAELPGTDPMDASNQPDFPGSPNLPEAGPYIVYADVWERSLTTLEDPALRDAGLNGADTCTRAQTMLQVKVCPADVDPENDIPQKGDAALTLTLHGNLDSGDACDPCAGQVEDGGGSIGNYLFRVEVHEVEGSADEPTLLKLKWSSENGTEQYAAQSEAQMPPGFVVSGRYSYEFFNLISEKHAGVHLKPGFNPTWGILKTAYEIPDGESDPKDFVRRWDGYCELTYDGSVWSLVEGFDKGVSLSTEVDDTTPGHVSLDPALTINLEALKLDLELKDKKFVAGDYWLSSVREAEHGPGSLVLVGGPPEGIVHHYLRLARVAADGSVEPYNDNADERRKSFPPLTDLWASDVDYKTDCDKEDGLFHNFVGTVKEALDKICELAAENIDYQADCSQGLFQGFEGTVKKALDKVCTIQAGNVFFNKPCDTSVYQGQTVNTVEDALKLLCDVQAGQIAYQPGAGCTALPSGTQTVQAALDALCARPAGGGGCRITIGEGGIFPTLEEAIKKLLEAGERDICLCLLPGDHTYPGQLIRVPPAGLRLCIVGCGPATRLHIVGSPAHFRGFASICLTDLLVIAENSPKGALIFESCLELSLRGATVHGFVTDDSLLRVVGAQTVAMHKVLLEASGPGSLELPLKILDTHSALADLYQVADRTVFDKKVPETAQVLAKLTVAVRRELARNIEERVKGTVLTARERRRYLDLVGVLRMPEVTQVFFVDPLQQIRFEAVRVRPAVALSIEDAGADWSLGECDILGIVVLYDTVTAGPLPKDLANLDDFVKQGAVGFEGTATTLRASGCRATRIDLGATKREALDKILLAKKGTLTGLFHTLMLTDCTLVNPENQLAVVNAHITSTVFEVEAASVAEAPRAAVVMGSSSIYVGNRGGGEAVIMNITPKGRSERAANLGIVIVG